MNRLYTAENISKLFYFRFFVQSVFMVKRTIFAKFQFALNIFAVLSSGVILSLTFRTLQRNNFYRTLFLAAHIYYS